jgi:hypothetical protein
MSVVHDGEQIRLVGACPVEDAETMLARLQQAPDTIVNLTECTHMHAAVAQALLVSGATTTGTSTGFLAEWLLPSLARQSNARSSIGRSADDL